VFCANGEHGNPDLRVLEAIVDSRIGPAHSRSENPQAKNRFRFGSTTPRHSTIKSMTQTRAIWRGSKRTSRPTSIKVVIR
jgi:hypothetical protein